MTTITMPGPGAGPLAGLGERIDGELITAGDRRYEAARRLWNASIDRRPAAIVQPRSARGVAAALRHARERGMEIAVRCGGHSLVGHSMSDGGLTIDLSAMSGVEVDPARRGAPASAEARCSVRWGAPRLRGRSRSPTATSRTPASAD